LRQWKVSFSLVVFVPPSGEKKGACFYLDSVPPMNL
jgi:hypothetical protein